MTDQFLQRTGQCLLLPESRQELQLKSTRVLSVRGELPLYIDLDPGSVIENQKQLGSCAGNSLSSVCESLIAMKSGNRVQLSRMFAYLIGQKNSGMSLYGRDAGATISGCLKAAKAIGLCLESLFQYPQNYAEGKAFFEANMQALLTAANQYKVGSYTHLETEQEIANYIGSGIGPVYLGILWTSNSDQKMISHWNFDGGGHAVYLRGYVTIQGKRWYKLPNSWGTGWADKGVALVHQDVVARWCTHQYSEIAGVTDMIYPQPRTFLQAGGVAA
jgi:hypothetical protein